MSAIGLFLAFRISRRGLAHRRGFPIEFRRSLRGTSGSTREPASSQVAPIGSPKTDGIATNPRTPPASRPGPRRQPVPVCCPSPRWPGFAMRKRALSVNGYVLANGHILREQAIWHARPVWRGQGGGKLPLDCGLLSQAPSVVPPCRNAELVPFPVHDFRETPGPTKRIPVRLGE